LVHTKRFTHEDIQWIFKAKILRIFMGHLSILSLFLMGVCCVTHIKAHLHLFLKKKKSDPQKKRVYNIIKFYSMMILKKAPLHILYK
jgi:hypothetical protein